MFAHFRYISNNAKNKSQKSINLHFFKQGRLVSKITPSTGPLLREKKSTRSSTLLWGCDIRPDPQHFSGDVILGV